jgi:hypothetical protein
VIKVFEDFELTTVGRIQSLLEANGIRTFLKNQFASGALGELPFVEICPQLYVLQPADLPAANRLIRQAAPPPVTSEPLIGWTCTHCDAEVDGELGVCWQCGSEGPPAKD